MLLAADEAAVAVTELLPVSVQVDGSRFRVALEAVVLPAHGVAEVCGAACGMLPGQLVAKPALRDSTGASLKLASDVIGALLSGGAIEIALTHGLEFDPLRPAGALENGSIRVSAHSGGRVVGELVIDEPFPRGTTLRHTLALMPGPVTGVVEVSVVLHSPAGEAIYSDWLLGDAPVLTGTVTPLPLEATEAHIRVQEKHVSIEPIAVDMSGIDASVIRRVRGGAARLTIDNPFPVTGTLELRLQGSGVAVRRSVQVGADRQTTRVALSAAELQALLGQTLTVWLSGVVTAQSGEVAVRPEQEIGITTSFELVLEIG